MIALNKDLKKELSLSAPDNVVIIQRTIALMKCITNGKKYFSGIMINT